MHNRHTDGRWRAFVTLVLWVVVSTTLNLGWEVSHLPLYQIPPNHLYGDKLRAVLHCTAGDALISASFYLTTALGLRSLAWIPRRMGIVLFISQAVLYTVYSEWRNVMLEKNWLYADSMPTLAGIGLSPLLQWIIVPGITVFLIRVLVRWQGGLPS